MNLTTTYPAQRTTQSATSLLHTPASQRRRGAHWVTTIVTVGGAMVLGFTTGLPTAAAQNPPAPAVPAPSIPAATPSQPDAAAAPAPVAPAPTVAPPPAPVAPAADPSLLGGPGESCRARADCQTGLRCFNGMCRDEREGMTCGSTAECGGMLRCVANVCTNPNAPSGGGSGGSGSAGGGTGDWMAFELEGVHGFVGIDLAGGPALPLGYDSGETGDVSGSFLFALRGGMTFGVGELAVEFSPVTFFPYTEADDPNLQLLASVGARIPITDTVHYAMRFGLGMMAVNTPGDVVGFQQRFDLLDIGFKVGHLIFDVHLPSFRHITDFDLGSIFMWQPGVSTNYVF